ncbi:hypothetical protein SAMN04488554_1079 [Ruania alba]|uniref:Uncharacterized protein n=1 Tax=Ruania alba TaxID=648782 RepID=A0A1H5ENJ5_9MICO|nr:hypothetical protein SAMN04488554_1079 [Ruania alba]
MHVGDVDLEIDELVHPMQPNIYTNTQPKLDHPLRWTIRP